MIQTTEGRGGRTHHRTDGRGRSAKERGGGGGGGGGGKPPSAVTEPSSDDKSLAQRLHAFVVARGGKINLCDEFALFATTLSAADRAAIKEAQASGVKKGLQSFVSRHPDVLQIAAGQGPDAQPLLLSRAPAVQAKQTPRQAPVKPSPSNFAPTGKSLEHRVFVRRMCAGRLHTTRGWACPPAGG